MLTSPSRSASRLGASCRRAALALLLIAGSGAAGADVSLRVEGRPSTGPIEAFVRVTDNGNPVTGLTASDFTVKIDGQAVTIAPGSVTPLAIVNDAVGTVTAVLDQGLLVHEWVNCHPLQNDATTTLRSADLVRFMAETGHAPMIVEFD